MIIFKRLNLLYVISEEQKIELSWTRTFKGLSREGNSPDNKLRSLIHSKIQKDKECKNKTFDVSLEAAIIVRKRKCSIGKKCSYP